MLITRTLIAALLLGVSLTSTATGETPSPKEKNSNANIAANTSTVSYTSTSTVSYAFHIDNSVNKNNTVDSALVILDKFDHTGAGVVRKVFYPNTDNQVIINELPAGKYYAEIYVLGTYKKHFSTIIDTAKTGKKNKKKETYRLDYTDVYVPGRVSIPAEDLKSFTYSK
jgi:hypothetical protein